MTEDEIPVTDDAVERERLRIMNGGQVRFVETVREVDRFACQG